MSLLDTALERRIHTRTSGGVGMAASVLAAAEPVLLRLAVITFLLVLAFLLLFGLVLGPIIRRVRFALADKNPVRLWHDPLGSSARQGWAEDDAKASYHIDVVPPCGTTL